MHVIWLLLLLLLKESRCNNVGGSPQVGETPWPDVSVALELDVAHELSAICTTLVTMKGPQRAS